MAPKIVTIGVYGFDEDGFFQALLEAGVDLFCDIRQRRGLRGSRYAFANSLRLQQRLGVVGIDYIHRKDLAPTQEIRRQQQEADRAGGTKKRDRNRLSPIFAEAYRTTILKEFDAKAFIDELDPETQVVALFCVEREPEACHRSLVADYLAQEVGLELEHIRP
jgi:uncharacterized protein (DUF488 family)